MSDWSCSSDRYGAYSANAKRALDARICSVLDVGFRVCISKSCQVSASAV